MDDEGRLPLKAYSVGGVHGLQLDDWSGIGIARFDTRSAADEAARRWNAHDGLVAALERIVRNGTPVDDASVLVIVDDIEQARTALRDAKAEA